jgi:nucleotide-binding universal stress UspA family protein
MSAVVSDVREARTRPARVMIAVHGGEPAGWGPSARRVVSSWTRPSIRILAVVTVPCPPFTSLIPPAARMYRAARATWEAAERERVQRVIDDVARAPLHDAEIAWLPVSYADPGRAIAEHARRWAADVLLVAGFPATGLWRGGVYDPVLRRAPCPVLVAPLAECEV